MGSRLPWDWGCASPWLYPSQNVSTKHKWHTTDLETILTWHWLTWLTITGLAKSHIAPQTHEMFMQQNSVYFCCSSRPKIKSVTWTRQFHESHIEWFLHRLLDVLLWVRVDPSVQSSPIGSGNRKTELDRSDMYYLILEIWAVECHAECPYVQGH